MKLLSSSHAFALPLFCAATLSLSVFSLQAQVAQSPPQNAQDLKAASQAPDAPVIPPELQNLVDTFVAAFKNSDEAALASCWHSPEAAASDPAAAGSTVPREQQARRRANDIATNTARMAQMRAASNIFGGPVVMKLMRVEVGRGGSTTANESTYDDVKLHFLAPGNNHLMMSIDDVAKINGVWKFRGSIKDELTIVLPDLP